MVDPLGWKLVPAKGNPGAMPDRGADSPRFYSFKVQVSLNHTLGGFKVNTKMQVLDLLERPIVGLQTRIKSK